MSQYMEIMSQYMDICEKAGLTLELLEEYSANNKIISERLDKTIEALDVLSSIDCRVLGSSLDRKSKKLAKSSKSPFLSTQYMLLWEISFCNGLFDLLSIKNEQIKNLSERADALEDLLDKQ